MESTEFRKATDSQQPSHAFDVFLSYSRKDRDFAVKLESALESYKAPKNLKSDKRNLNVFRDEADIEAAEDYYRTIEQHLKDSAKLVVICSPDARQSKYIEDEIRRFIEAHGERDIIPVLVRGKANNETTDEGEKAFPDILTENRMPLAASFLGYNESRDKLDKGQFRGSWYSVLSAIYGIDRRKLEQIDERARARRRKIALGTAAAIILILSVALVFALISRREAVKAREDAERRRNESISSELSLYSTSLLQSDPELSLILATKAAQTQQTQQSENALRQALVKAPLRVLRAVETGNNLGAETINATFSPDGKHILAWSANKAQAWDVEGARKVFEIQGDGIVMVASYSPDGKLIVTGSGDTVRTWDASTGSKLAEWRVKLEGLAMYISGLTISPDGKFLLVERAVSARAQVFEISSGRFVAGFEGSSPVFSPDGQSLLIVTPKEKLDLFDTQSWKRVAQIDAKVGRFSSDDKYILVGSASARVREDLYDWTSHLRLYDRQSRREIRSASIAGQLKVAEISPDGHLIAATTSKGLYLWSDAETSAHVLADWSNKAAEWLEIPPLSFSPDSKFLLSVHDAILLYDVKAKHLRPIAELGGRLNVIPLNAVFSPDGMYALTVNNDGTIFVWDLNVWRSPFERRLEQRDFNSSSFSHDAKFVAAEEGGETESETSAPPQVRVWKTENGEPVQTFAETENAYSIAFSPDDKLLIIFSGDTSYVWELSSGRSLAELKKSDFGKVEDYSPDGKLFVTSSDKGARVWDANNRQLVRELPTGNAVTRAVFSPDSKLVLIIFRGEDSSFVEHLCDLNGQCSTVTTHKGAEVSDAMFSPDGKLILSVSQDNPQVIDAQTGRVRAELRSNTDWILSASFSPDGKYVMTTIGFEGEEEESVPSYDEINKVLVWDLSGSNLVYEFKGHDARMLSGRFTPDGKSVRVIADDGTLLTYSCEVCVPQDELIKEALARNLRDLTPDERLRYLHAK